MAGDVERMVDRLEAADPAAAVYPRAAHMALLEGAQTPEQTRLLDDLHHHMDAEIHRVQSDVEGGNVYEVYRTVTAARLGQTSGERSRTWQRSKVSHEPPTVDDVKLAYLNLVGLLTSRIEKAEA